MPEIIRCHRIWRNGIRHQWFFGEISPKEDVTGRILSALHEAISGCRGPEEIWMAQDLKRAMILIGGLDEEVVRRILQQEGI